MTLQKLDTALTVCKVQTVQSIDLNADVYFIGKEENFAHAMQSLADCGYTVI